MLRILLVTVALAVTNSQASIDFSYGNAPLYPLQPKLISESVGQPNEIPTKIVKITKTVAVKVPVPYPVKIPHHIPVAIPVNRPVPVPIPHLVKVLHPVPVEVARPVPVPLPQQVPVFVTKTVRVPQPVPVAHPVHVPRPIYFDPLSYAARHADEPAHDSSEDLYARASSYGQGYEDGSDQNPAYSQSDDFRPSQPDYASQQDRF